MILLADNCLVFQTASGESIPHTAESISVEVLGDAANLFDPNSSSTPPPPSFIITGMNSAAKPSPSRNFPSRWKKSCAASSSRQESAAQASGSAHHPVRPPPARPAIRRRRRTFFFPRLRDELQALLRQSPQMLCFQGLRQCVKQLSGAQRWSRRCQELQDQIVEFLRTCMSRETSGTSCALVVK